ncbi:MerR family transcriptional regulator [Gracilibacillus phocaeensis]|uniref:MerR family transcriptional regulator n=1 Tax=Gracilibacillus phocaeensis TaxID=2042304 RepID=UPI0010310796|nr:MerR family transcriptional regulator [Gracilibacillus phocaeensis]
MTGVTERTLHYYDRKGVLTPTSYTQNGYRLYSHDDIFKMQKILTLKYLGYSLKEIIDYLSKNSKASVQDTLFKQKELLKQKREELDHIINTFSTVEQIIQDEKMESDLLLAIIHSIQMENKQKQWLSNQLPKPIVDQIFMEHIPKEERMNRDRELLIAIHKLQGLYESGVPPHHIDVQHLMKQLERMLNNILEPKYQEELEKLKTEESSLYHFSFISKGFQDYTAAASDILNKQNNRPRRGNEYED